MESRIEYRGEYRVLAPESVAWHIQAALTADRSGNYHTRDLALAEAQRIARERGLAASTCYDCRTTGEQLAALAAGLETVEVAIDRINMRLAALKNAPSIGDQRRLDTMYRVAMPLPGADAMRDQYDAEHDAAHVSYWDMRLLEMVERVNDRLAALVGGG